MRILAVDTSAVCAAVAVTEDGKILSECQTNTGLTHSRTLMPMIDSTLRNAEISLDSIDFFACSAGPGSFTGVRIGVAAIKGLCDGLKKKCLPVSTLEALAYNLLGRSCTAVSVMDARCNQVYCGIFRVEGEKVSRLTDDEAIKIEDLGEKLKSYDDVIFVGDGARLCHRALGYAIASPSELFQKGSSVAFCAAENYSEEKLLEASQLMPVYLRLPQAERELKNKS
ncbi:MAG: tRNA (adenosine(37)-N6)-threonylcarbamoyltransferase complex dimerization subunit type 1 TsaB [Ruminococcaceae bacterium]|nr:tRNA (adenosine(37)-N6)-threonylcarbamoyltransferase complex dimerization subunit type 1 TsaB [Oscillospiraceae bacterium]